MEKKLATTSHSRTKTKHGSKLQEVNKASNKASKESTRTRTKLQVEEGGWINPCCLKCHP